MTPPTTRPTPDSLFFHTLPAIIPESLHPAAKPLENRDAPAHSPRGRNLPSHLPAPIPPRLELHHVHHPDSFATLL